MQCGREQLMFTEFTLLQKLLAQRLMEQVAQLQQIMWTITEQSLQSLHLSQVQFQERTTHSLVGAQAQALIKHQPNQHATLLQTQFQSLVHQLLTM